MRKLVVVVLAGLSVASWIACQPRMQTYTPPQPTPAATPAPTPTQTAAAPAPTLPDPTMVLGPAFTPNGLVFPPGWQMPPMPSGLPFPIPTAFPFPTATAAPTATATAPAPAPTITTWGSDSASMEARVLAIVNEYRAKGAVCGSKAFPPVPPLTMEPALQKAARGHSQDMATRNYFDHTSPEGTGPSERMKGAGFFGGYSGENIAAGNSTPDGTMSQWMGSPGHCSNIMDKDFKYLGVGTFTNPAAKYKSYWTQNFGG